MKDNTTVHYTQKTLPKGKTDWQRISALSDEEIEKAVQTDIDTALWTQQMLKDAHLRMPKRKVSVHMYLDQEIIEWFKGGGKGYQSRINAVLKSYIHNQC